MFFNRKSEGQGFCPVLCAPARLNDVSRSGGLRSEPPAPAPTFPQKRGGVKMRR